MNELDVARWEIGRHVTALTQALAEWDVLPELQDVQTLEEDVACLRLLDQILFRFTKLQDAMGQRLVPASLAALGEPFEDWPMRDRLDRLEKLRLVEAENWYAWRDIRNRLAHEYPDQPDVRLANINAAVVAASELAACARRWLARLDEMI